MDGGKMTIPTLPEYVFPSKPVPQITPFTYRDGVTMLKKLDGIVRYINKELVPFVNENYSELADAFEEQVNLLIAAVNAAIDAVINDSVEVQDPVMAGIINNVNSATRTLLDSLYGDSAISSIISDENSDTRSKLDELYATVASVTAISTIINSGRLSESTLDNTFANKDTQNTVEIGRLSVNNVARTTKKIRRIQSGLDGVVGDGITDDTAAIQAIFDTLVNGDMVVFEYASGGSFLISGTIEINVNNLHILGVGRDHYSTSLMKNNAGAIFEVNASGTIFELVALESSVATIDSALADGIIFNGTVNGDIDSNIKACSFYKMRRAVIVSGRNATFNNNLFSNCKTAIYVVGKNGVYHNDNWTSRGLYSYDDRFHTCGASESDGVIWVTNGAQHSMSIVKGASFDIGGNGICVLIEGISTTTRHRFLHFSGISFFQVNGKAFKLVNVERSKIDDCMIIGTGNSKLSNYEIDISGSSQIVLNNVQQYLSKGGANIDTSSSCGMNNCTFSNNVGNGINFVTNQSRMRIVGCEVAGNTVYGVAGSVAVTLQGQGNEIYSNTTAQLNNVTMQALTPTGI